jgi:hypothetical protein
MESKEQGKFLQQLREKVDVVPFSQREERENETPVLRGVIESRPAAATVAVLGPLRVPTPVLADK